MPSMIPGILPDDQYDVATDTARVYAVLGLRARSACSVCAGASVYGTGHVSCSRTVTTAPPKDRDVEAAKAPARAAERYGRAG